MFWRIKSQAEKKEKKRTHVRRVYDGTDRANIDNRPLSRNQQRRKNLDRTYQAPYVDLEHFLGSIDVEVQRRHDDRLSGIVYQVIQLAFRCGSDRLQRGLHARGGCRIHGEESHIGQTLERGHL